MGCRRRRCHEKRRRCFRHRKHRRREHEKVLATVHNRFEHENEHGGEFEKIQQTGNALALKHSNNNHIEQENESKSEED
jgi:hypothetical protein